LQPRHLHHGDLNVTTNTYDGNQLVQAQSQLPHPAVLAMQRVVDEEKVGKLHEQFRNGAVAAKAAQAKQAAREERRERRKEERRRRRQGG
jgi:hypothetical protein